jgi:diguanylate cyclase (GGDEF)-like protein
MQRQVSTFIFGPIAILVLIMLYFSSITNFLLYHTLSNLFNILISTTIFLITFNSARYLKNNFLLSVGIAFVFIAVLDIFHMLTYPGFTILPASEPVSNQFWIAARVLESMAILISLISIRRAKPYKIDILFLSYFSFTALIFLSVLVWENFPIPTGSGDMPSMAMILVECAIVGMLVTSLYFLIRNRNVFTLYSFKTLRIAIFLMILSMSAFALEFQYSSFLILAGHYLKFFAFYFIYKVLVAKAIEEPQTLVFNELNREKEMALAQTDELQRRVVLDGLTGLYNHQYLCEKLEDAIKKYRRNNRDFAILMADIDLFKNVNDQHGHLVGDEILCELGQVLKLGLREIDIVGRYGGEEFLVILEETEGNEAVCVAEKIRKRVETHDFKHAIRLSVSIGVSVYLPGMSVNELIGQADQNLYSAKNTGRNRTV